MRESKIDLEKLKSLSRFHNTKELCEIFGIKSVQYFNRFCRENNVKIIRSDHGFDIDYFTRWSPNMAYILGFFAGDGCLYQRRNDAWLFSISINKKDIEILKFIKKELKTNKKIKYRTGDTNGTITEYASLSIQSDDFCKPLLDMGFGARKSYNMPIFDIPKEFKFDYLRGLFDADGSISICNKKGCKTKRYYWYIANINSDYLKKLKQQMGVKFGKISINKNKCDWRIYKKEEIEDMCGLIYNGNFCLQRKYDRFVNMPKAKRSPIHKMLNEEKTISEWGYDPRLKVNRRLFLSRINSGWDVDEAFNTPHIKNQHCNKIKE